MFLKELGPTCGDGLASYTVNQTIRRDNKFRVEMMD